MAACRSGQKTPGPEAINVAAHISGRLARRLFRGHVGGRAEERSGSGQSVVGVGRQILH